MPRTPTLPARTVWNDPFRLLLAISLAALVAWIAVQSGAQQASTSTRTGAVDIDPGDTASIVAYDETSLFDMPVDETARDAAAAPTPAPVVTGGSGDSTSTRGGSGTRGTSRQPATGGGTTTRPPSTGGGTATATATAPVTGGDTQTSPGNGPAAQAPIVSPGNSGTSGQPGTTGLSGVPAVELPLPALPGTSGSASQDGGVGVTGEPIKLVRELVVAPS